MRLNSVEHRGRLRAALHARIHSPSAIFERRSCSVRQSRRLAPTAPGREPLLLGRSPDSREGRRTPEMREIPPQCASSTEDGSLGWTAANVRHSYTRNGLQWCHIPKLNLHAIFFRVLGEAWPEIDNFRMCGAMRVTRVASKNLAFYADITDEACRRNHQQDAAVPRLKRNVIASRSSCAAARYAASMR